MKTLINKIDYLSLSNYKVLSHTKSSSKCKSRKRDKYYEHALSINFNC